MMKNDKFILVADHKKREYIIPESLEERFLCLCDKIIKARKNNKKRIFRGLVIVLENEFNKMRI